MEQESPESQQEAAVKHPQGKVYSRTFKAGLLASGHFLTSLVGLASFAVLARVLTMRDYATYRQTMLAYRFAAPLLMLGLPQALYYFLPGEKKRARAILVENLLLLSAMGAVFSLFILLGGNRLLAWRFRNPDLARTLVILAPYPLFMLPASALSACLMARDRVKRVAIYNVISRLVMLACVVTAALIWRTPAAALVGTVLGAGIVLFPALKLMLAACDVGQRRPTRSGMWSQTKYSVPLGIASMLGAISLSLDKVIVSSMCTAEQFAVYVNGALEIPLIGVITGSVMSVVIPDFARYHKAGDHEAILGLWHRATAKCALFIFPIGIFLFAMAPEVMRLLFSAKYSESAIPFRIYLLRLPARITAYGAIFMATGNNRLILSRVVVSLMLNFALSILLVHWIGAVGAAVATVVVLYLWAIPYCLFHIRRILRVGWRSVFPWAELAKIGGLCALASVVLVPLFWLRWSDAVATGTFGVLFVMAVLTVYAFANLVSPSVVIERLVRGPRS